MISKVLRLFKKLILLLGNRAVTYGKNTNIDWKVRIYNNNNKLIIGDDVYLRGVSKGYQAGMPFPTTILMDIPNSFIQIGKNTRINGAYIHAQKHISIGSNCVIASGVNIIDSNGHILNSNNRTKGRDKAEDIIIGDNVWIGLNAIILKNTIIGKNCVISAGSVVKGKFPDNSLIVGNPATTVKTLHIENTNSNSN